MKTKKKPKKSVKKPVYGSTHVHIILDRSGSMCSIRNDVVGGLNQFIEKQQALRGKCTLSMVQFDSQDPYEVMRDFVDIQEVQPIGNEYLPRASTPLYDAMGRGINDLTGKLKDLSAKPKHVVMVIMTDGMENASHEFTREQVFKLVKERTDKDGWHFVYLGANQDAMAVGQTIGLSASLSNKFTPRNTVRTISLTSDKIGDLRAGVSFNMNYTAADKAALTSE